MCSQQFSETVDRGQGCFQIVGDGCNHVGLLSVGELKPMLHLIKVLIKLSDLVITPQSQRRQGMDNIYFSQPGIQTPNGLLYEKMNIDDQNKKYTTSDGKDGQQQCYIS
ncbi:hypothetical protein D3C74_422240 [compost metagenome]